MSDPRLEVLDASGRRVVPVDKPVFLIGRRSGNDLCVLGAGVSREHAEIARVDDRYVVRDRSSQGTFVNDQPVSEADLAHGDRIRLGRSDEIRLVFLTQSEMPAPLLDSGSPVNDLRQLAALFEGLRAMGSARAVDEVLTMVLDLTIEFTGAERGFILLAGSDGLLDFTLGRAAGRVTLSGRTFGTSRRIPDEVFATGEARSVSDLLDDQASSSHAGTIALGIRHVLCLPLQVARYASQGDAAPARRIGVLYLDSRRKGTLMSETTRTGVERLATEAAAAIENARLYREELEKGRLEHELNIAAQIQRALLPEPRYSARGIDVAAVSVPCRSIGGDFFDYLELPGGAFGFALGDVAGKGASAALLTASVQSIFFTRASEGEGPALTVARVNRGVIRRAVQARFVTMFYGMLGQDGVLTYSNAGHSPPLLVGRRGLVRLEQGGLVLGLVADASYEQGQVQLEAGDVIVLFSDGLSECTNEADDQYEEERIARCVGGALHLDATGILDRLLADVRTFAGGAASHDDLTAMVVKYTG